MKKKLILLPLIAGFLCLTLSSWWDGIGYATGGDHTGASSSSTAGCGGSGCHGTSATSSTTVSIQLLSSGTPTCVYVGGTTYTIRITATNTGSSSLPKWGYQLSAVLTGSTTNKGTFTAPSGSHTGTYGGIVCVEPSGYLSPTSGSGGSGTTYVQDITWVAPTAGTGSVTIFGAANLVNNNFTNDAGDLWNFSSLVITESLGGITGTTTVCVGSTSTLSNAAGSGGTWSSSNTAVATIGTSGVVSGVTPGTATITYSICAGTATTTVTVISGPSAITGTPAVCVGSTTALSNSTGTGTWSSSNTSASVGASTGVVTGLAAGTPTITFTLTSTGCTAVKPVTVNPLPGAITGPTNVCPTATITLSDAGGGTWASANTTTATVGSSSGIVTGGTTGTVVITYTLPTGCFKTTTVTVGTGTLAITGNPNVCPTLTTTLSNAALGGTWSSANTAIATVAPGSGVVTGVTAGTTTISYTNTSGCVATILSTVYPTPLPITGLFSVCEGLTNPLSDATGGGTWSSSATSVATMGASSGIETGILAGTATITYTEPTHGCVTNITSTVNPNPVGITGTLSACPGFSPVLSDGTFGGTWTSGTTAVATISPSSGTVSALVAGTTSITYTLTTGCLTASTFTVNPSPSAITGVAAVCSGSTTTLSDLGGGTWTSGNTSLATIGSSSGLVTAVGTFGSVLITYTLPVTGCTAVKIVTVNLLPNPIGGTPTVCSGSTTIFTDPGGGTWSSSNTAVALAGSGGIISGIGAGGTSTITYTLPTGCMAFKVVTVNPLPAAITGTPTVCVNATTALSDTDPGGTWSATSTIIATVSGTGIVTGAVQGTTTITYGLGTGCKATHVITVYPTPGNITGTVSVCTGSTVSLTDATAGGNWTSGSTAIATIGSSSGSVAGVSAGTSSISYTIATTGCSAIKIVTVNPTPGAITGTGIVCKGLTTTLSDAGGGNWSSGNTSIATVGSGTGVVTGTGAGTALITYALPVTGCKATTVVTVNPLSPITGTTSLCAGLTSTLSDGTFGGIWSSSNTSVATINSSTGFLSAVASGSSIVNYSLSSGCVATTTVNVVSAPSAITGNKTVCLGSTTSLTDAGGGTWTSGTSSIATVGFTTGVVNGLSLGTANITYSLGTGCTASAQVTVSNVPAAITGTGVMCEGATAALSDATGSGTWNTTNTNVSVGSTGIVTGINAGTAIISYSLATGCSAVKTVTVNASPGSIAGTTEVCAGSATVLSDAGGGTWASGTTTVATIGFSSGVVTGSTAGTTIITYTLPATGCLTITTLTVDPLPGAISGSNTVCAGATTTLSDAGGGTWTSGNTTVSVGLTTGIVTGSATGTAIITYMLPTGCSATKTMTINPVPAAITGVTTLCAGGASTLSDATTGGTWTSSNTSVATVSFGSGGLSGIAAGTAVITYTRSSGCQAYANVTVNPLPTAISGTLNVCAGATTGLSDADGGGTWTSGSTSIATVDPTLGTVTGAGAGTASIVYTLSTGCSTAATVTVNPLPATIAGATTICTGGTTTLSDALTGGTWASSNTTIATIDAAGVLNGVSSGSVVIDYTLPTGCATSSLIVVNPSPAGITGTGIVCAGGLTTLSDATPGGSWSSSSTGIATVGTGTGDVTGVSGGSVTIIYSLSTGCSAVTVVTVNPTPAAITGTAKACAGLTSTLSDATGGGTWSSSTTSVATTSTGVVTGVSAGTSVIAYTLSTGCATSVTFTVNPTPAGISGTTHVCVTVTTNLSDASAGGTWTTSTSSVATVGGSTGIVTGVAAGTTTITYTLSTGCKTSTPVTVNPAPFAGTISGATIVCMGSPATLSDGAAGGSWSSSNPAVATVGATTGIVTGVTTGTTIITYSVTNICGTADAVYTDTVLDIPTAGTITGIDSVCEGSTITISDPLTGGVWSSSNTAIATVSGGTITGVAAGSAVISYSISTVCGTGSATLSVKVKSLTSCSHVSVATMTGNDGFKVYPNPSTGQFVVDMPVTQNGATITIMDMLGKVIERRSIDDTRQQQVPFNLSRFPAGSYVVKVNAGARTFRQKIEIW